MRRVLVRYTVKPEHVAENERLVGAVYQELHRVKPSGVRYATFRLDDGVTFIHVASIETDDGRNPLDDLTAFREFQQDLRTRVAEGPSASELREIGSFRMLGD